MAVNNTNFSYEFLQNGKVSFSYTDKDGKTVKKTVDQNEAASIFTENGYTDAEAEQIVKDLFDVVSYDTDKNNELSFDEIAQGLKSASTEEAGGSGAAGTAGDAQADTDGVAGDQPVNPNANETQKNQYRNQSNADLATSQGDAEKNFDASKKDMDTARTAIDTAKDSFAETEKTQNEAVEAAEKTLDDLTKNSEDIKAQFGEDIANALEDVKAKQTAEDEAQTSVNEKTTAVADATTAVSDATTAVSEANEALTSAQAALDAAPMFVATGKTDENGNPIMEPNGELAALQEAVTAAEAKVKEAEDALAEKKEALTKAEEDLEAAKTTLDEAKTARDESQKAYEETVAKSDKAEDETLKAITAAVQGVSQAQDARTEAMKEAQKAVTDASTTLKEASETFNNNQQALNEINREVNTRKAKGIWDTTSDKTPEEIEAEEKEKAEKADEAKDEAEGKEGEEKESEGEEIPDKGNAENLKQAANNDMVTYAMVKDELKLAADNNVNLKDYVYAKGQDGVFHLYNAQTGKSIAREFGAQKGDAMGLNVWGGGYDIVGNGSGYLKESTMGDYKTVYAYGEEPDTIIATEKQYNTSSPLSFDLDGNGVGTTDEMIAYDIDGDGTLDNIFNSADAVLVFDKDGDGISGEDGSECFGDNTDLDGDGKADGYKDGFEALKALAKKEHLIGGNDTKLDDNDLAVLEKKYGLKIKANGYTSEAVSLASLGISNINLSTTDKTSTDYNFDGKGNELMHQQGATFEINGEEREYADLWHRKFGNLLNKKAG